MQRFIDSCVQMTLKERKEEDKKWKRWIGLPWTGREINWMLYRGTSWKISRKFYAIYVCKVKITPEGILLKKINQWRISRKQVSIISFSFFSLLECNKAKKEHKSKANSCRARSRFKVYSNKQAVSYSINLLHTHLMLNFFYKQDTFKSIVHAEWSL